jgi:hypothetical protein
MLLVIEMLIGHRADIALAFDQNNLRSLKLPVISRNRHPERIPGTLDIRKKSE